LLNQIAVRLAVVVLVQELLLVVALGMLTLFFFVRQ